MIHICAYRTCKPREEANYMTGAAVSEFIIQARLAPIMIQLGRNMSPIIIAVGHPFT